MSTTWRTSEPTTIDQFLADIRQFGWSRVPHDDSEGMTHISNGSHHAWIREIEANTDIGEPYVELDRYGGNDQATDLAETMGMISEYEDEYWDIYPEPEEDEEDFLPPKSDRERFGTE